MIDSRHFDGTYALRGYDPNEYSSRPRSSSWRLTLTLREGLILVRSVVPGNPAMSTIWRGLTNPFRSMARAIVVASLLALVIGLLAVMIQASLVSRKQIANLESRVRTLIELREAGAFGTGGFGGDNPVGEKDFSYATLAKARGIPHANELARVDPYVYTPQIDASKPNAYAMIIGTPPGATLRAIGEVDYESSKIIAGRTLLSSENPRAHVAVVGKLFALQRMGISSPSSSALEGTGRSIRLGGDAYAVIGIYTTGNDFGDNHVFVPVEAFRKTFHSGSKLTKIFVTVDSVAHVADVAADLKRRIREADVVTTPETVTAARASLGSLAITSTYGALLLFAGGAILVVFVMVLSTRERVREIGTLKAIGASNAEIALQFFAEAVSISGLGGFGALLVAVPGAQFLGRALGLPTPFDGSTLLNIGASALAFAAIGSLYPVIRGTQLSPVEAMVRG